MKPTFILLAAALVAVVSPPRAGAEPRPGMEGQGAPPTPLRLFPRDPGPPSSPSSPSSPSTPPSTATPPKPISGPPAGGMPSADPAPPPTGTPADAEGTRRLAVAPRLGYRLGDAAREVGPRDGFGFSGTCELTYVRVGPRFEGSVGVDFGYDYFATSAPGTVIVDNEIESLISETSFVLVHTAAARLGRVRPFLSVGAGGGVGYFESAALPSRPRSDSDGHLLGRVSLGLDVTVTRIWMVTIRADYTAVRGISRFRSDDGQTHAVFGDLLGVGLGIAYRF